MCRMLTIIPSFGVPLVWTAALTTTVGCGQSGVVIRNNEPVAVIVSPAAGETVPEGLVTTLRGTVSDTNHGAADLLATWSAGKETLCEQAPVAADGSTTCEVIFEAGTTEIVLQGVDPGGEASLATLSLSVRPNDTPIVDILSPVLDTSYPNDSRIVVEAFVSDYETDAADLLLSWSDGTGAPVDLDLVPDSDGSLTGSLLWPVGQHSLSLTAVDEAGAVGVKTVTFEVEDAE